MIVVCELCSREADHRVSQVKKSKHHFCSSVCRLAWREQTFAKMRVQNLLVRFAEQFL